MGHASAALRDSVVVVDAPKAAVRRAQERRCQVSQGLSCQRLMLLLSSSIAVLV